MRKFLFTAIALIICTVLLCSCTGGDISSSIDSLIKKVDDKISSYPSGDTTPTLKDKPTTFGSGETESKPEEEPEEAPLAVCENGSVILKVTGASMESWGYVLDVTAENNSPRPLLFTADGGMLNNLILTPVMSFEAEASGVFDGEVVWYSSQLEGSKINDVSSALFHFTAVSTDTDETQYADSSVIAYPNGKGAAKRYSLPEKSAYTGQMTLQTEYGKFSANFSPTGRNDSNGYTLDVFLDNNSEYDVSFTITSAEINGKDFNPYWNRSLPATGMVYSSVCWYGNPFEDAGVSPEEIETVVLGISVLSENDGSVLAEGEITINTENQ